MPLCWHSKNSLRSNLKIIFFHSFASTTKGFNEKFWGRIHNDFLCSTFMGLHVQQCNNGKQSTVNKSLDGSMYPS
jgi:hypothetical protein